MELTPATIESILAFFETADLEYLNLATGDTSLILQKPGAGAVPVADAAPAATAVGLLPATGPAQAGASSDTAVAVSPAGPTTTATPAAPEPARGEDVITITAPVVGVFYASAEPGSAPYVEVGSTVEVGTTLGLVEVMKMYNSISSTVRGAVVEVLVKNEEFVEFGQPIMVIRPETAA